MYDEVTACVKQNKCSEKLEYVEIAAGETRGTIHKAVTLVDESCKLRGGAGRYRGGAGVTRQGLVGTWGGLGEGLVGTGGGAGRYRGGVGEGLVGTGEG